VKKKKKKFLDVEFTLNGDIHVHQIFFVGGANVSIRKLVEKGECIGVDGVINDWLWHGSRSGQSGSVAVDRGRNRNMLLVVTRITSWVLRGHGRWSAPNPSPVQTGSPTPSSKSSSPSVIAVAIVVMIVMVVVVGGAAWSGDMDGGLPVEVDWSILRVVADGMDDGF